MTTLTSLGCVCLTVLLGFGVWNNNILKPETTTKPNNETSQTGTPNIEDDAKDNVIIINGISHIPAGKHTNSTRIAHIILPRE